MCYRRANNSDLIAHRGVKPIFISPCGFGENSAALLKQQLSPKGRPSQARVSWIIRFKDDPGPHPIGRLLHKSDSAGFTELRFGIQQAPRANTAIRTIPRQQASTTATRTPERRAEQEPEERHGPVKPDLGECTGAFANAFVEKLAKMFEAAELAPIGHHEGLKSYHI